MSEPIVTTTADLDDVLRQVTVEGAGLSKVQFHYQLMTALFSLTAWPQAESSEIFETTIYDIRKGWLLWASFERPDANTGAIGRGRDEIVWEGATVSGVAKTCWLLLELLARHELMEGFKFDGARIFDPHNSVEALASIQK